MNQEKNDQKINSSGAQIVSQIKQQFDQIMNNCFKQIQSLKKKQILSEEQLNLIDNYINKLKNTHKEQILLKLTYKLCKVFAQKNNCWILDEIMGIMSVDYKYTQKDNLNLLNEKPLPQVTDAIIALPYEPEISQIEPNSLSDVKINTNSYLQQDQCFRQQYLKQQFFVVQREGISSFFIKNADIISQNLFQPILKVDWIQMPLNSLCRMISLIQHISVVLYSDYLMQLYVQVSEKLLLFLRNGQNKHKLSKLQSQQLLYTMSNIINRWNNTAYSSKHQEWRWQMQKQVILLFLQSQVSQKKLHSVKMLSEICRRVTYGGGIISNEQLRNFIENYEIIGKIYRADNHPEIINRGTEIFQFICLQFQLTTKIVYFMFDLLQRCHETVCRGLYITLQNTGQKNLQLQRQVILDGISKLPRSGCFMSQTLSLVQTLMILTPSNEIHESLEKLYGIMIKHYERLKPSLQSRIINIYFEVFLMGIQQGTMTQANAVTILEPIMKNINNNLSQLMMQILMSRLKEQSSKNIGHSCMQIMNRCINLSFSKYHIHKKITQENKNSLPLLITKIIELYQMHKICEILPYEELEYLVSVNNSFTKYLQYYAEQEQELMLKTMLEKYKCYNLSVNCNIGEKIQRVRNFINLYHIVSKSTQNKFITQIQEQFLTEKSVKIRNIWADLVNNKSLKEMIAHIKSNEQDHNLIGYLLLIKKAIKKIDQKGYGSYVPLAQNIASHKIIIKINNSTNIMQPYQFVTSAENYQTLYELLANVLLTINMDLHQIKVKFNERYLTMKELYLRVIDIKGNNNDVQFVIESSKGCEWFDSDQLVAEGHLKANVIEIIQQIFQKYCSNGLLSREQVVSIFKLATRQQYITIQDSRIKHLFSNYSLAGLHLTEEQWIKFYEQSANINPILVIQNLINLGYEQNFNKLYLIQKLVKTKINQDRLLIAQHPQLYHNLFRILIYSTVQLTQLIIQILYLLPISVVIQQQILVKSWIINNFFMEQIHNYYYWWYISSIVLLRNLNISQVNLTLLCQHYAKIILFICLQKHYHTIFYQFISNTGAIMIRYYYLIDESNEKIKKIFNMNNQQLIDFRQKIILHKNIKIGIKINEILQNTNLCQKLCSLKNSESLEHLLLLLTIQNLTQKQQQLIIMNDKLIFNQNITIRKVVNSIYYILSINNNSIIEYYYSLKIDKKQQNCKQYFDILNLLIEKQNDLNRYQVIAIDLQHLLLNISNKNKQILMGELITLNNVILYNPSIKINEKILDNLFQECVESNTRLYLYQLCDKIATTVYKLKQIKYMLEDVQISKNSNTRNNQYMGLYNLGCICYINSILQQIYMIKPIRNAIHSTHVNYDSKNINILDNKYNNNNNNKNNSNTNNRYFHILQILMYQLQYGDRQFWIPNDFCSVFLDNQNNKINIYEQHDADQFLIHFLNQLENTLSSQKQINIIQQFFGGTIDNIISCQSCFTYNHKLQNMYVLSLPIKNQHTLQECLNHLMQPQIICDYYCSCCDQQVPVTHKTHRFHKLPPYLFVHLQRLVFDLETFSKIKLDHPVDFPISINLAPYFIQDYNQDILYELKGFIVHVGTSDSGHYYSLIKENQQWIKFDDSRVDTWSWQTGQHQRNNSYLLIYQRKDFIHKNIEKQIGNPQAMQEVQKDIKNLRRQRIVLQDSFMQFILCTLASLEIPQQYINSQPNQICTPYHPNYHSLPESIKQKLILSHTIILKAIQLQAEIRQKSPNNIKRGQQTHNIQKITSYLIMIYHLCPSLAQSTLLMFNQKDLPYQYLYKHSHPIIRQAYLIIITKIVSILMTYKSYSLLIHVPNQQSIQQFFLKIMNSLPQIGKNCAKMNEYFELLLFICQMSFYCLQWFQAHKLGPKLISFILQNDSPVQDKFTNMPLSVGIGKKLEIINVIIEIVVLLFQIEKNLDENNDTIEVQVYCHFGLYKRLLQDRYNYRNINWMACEVSRNNLQITNKIISFVLQAINRFSHQDDYIAAYIHLLYGLLLIEDSYQNKRIQQLLGVPILMKNDTNEYLISHSRDRICRYWNPIYQMGDQIIFCFLQLLYTNKNALTYFVFVGIKALMKIIVTIPQARVYLLKLPSPCELYTNYNSWATLLIQQAMSQQMSILAEKKIILHEITSLLIDVQIHENQVNWKKNNYIFQISGKLQKITQFKDLLLQLNLKNLELNKVKNVLKLEYTVRSFQRQEHQQYQQVIEINIDTKNKLVFKYKLVFEDYLLQFFPGYYELALPYDKQFIKNIEIDIAIQDNKAEQLISQRVKQNESSPHEQKIQQQGFECPFCGAWFNVFISKCNKCGQDWGQMY